MFDNKLKFFENKSRRTECDKKHKKLKNHAKPKEVLYKLEVSRQSSSQLKSCPLELKPTKLSDSSLEYYREKEELKSRRKCKKSKSKCNHFKSSQQSVDDSILTGLQTVIDLCGLLEEYDKENKQKTNRRKDKKKPKHEKINNNSESTKKVFIQYDDKLSTSSSSQESHDFHKTSKVPNEPSGFRKLIMKASRSRIINKSPFKPSSIYSVSEQMPIQYSNQPLASFQTLNASTFRPLCSQTKSIEQPKGYIQIFSSMHCNSQKKNGNAANNASFTCNMKPIEEEPNSAIRSSVEGKRYCKQPEPSMNPTTSTYEPSSFRRRSQEDDINQYWAKRNQIAQTEYIAESCADFRAPSKISRGSSLQSITNERPSKVESSTGLVKEYRSIMVEQPESYTERQTCDSAKHYSHLSTSTNTCPSRMRSDMYIAEKSRPAILKHSNCCTEQRECSTEWKTCNSTKCSHSPTSTDELLYRMKTSSCLLDESRRVSIQQPDCCTQQQTEWQRGSKKKLKKKSSTRVVDECKSVNIKQSDCCAEHPSFCAEWQTHDTGMCCSDLRKSTSKKKLKKKSSTRLVDECKSVSVKQSDCCAEHLNFCAEWQKHDTEMCCSDLRKSTSKKKLKKKSSTRLVDECKSVSVKQSDCCAEHLNFCAEWQKHDTEMCCSDLRKSTSKKKLKKKSSTGLVNECKSVNVERSDCCAEHPNFCAEWQTHDTGTCCSDLRKSNSKKKLKKKSSTRLVDECKSVSVTQSDCCAEHPNFCAEWQTHDTGTCCSDLRKSTSKKKLKKKSSTRLVNESNSVNVIQSDCCAEHPNFCSEWQTHETGPCCSDLRRSTSKKKSKKKSSTRLLNESSECKTEWQTSDPANCCSQLRSIIGERTCNIGNSTCFVDSSKSAIAQQPNSHVNWRTCDSTKYLTHLPSSISSRSPKTESSCFVDNSKSTIVQQPNSEANRQTCDSTKYLPSSISGRSPKTESSCFVDNSKSTIVQQPNSEANRQTCDSTKYLPHLHSSISGRSPKMESSCSVDNSKSTIVQQPNSEANRQTCDSTKYLPHLHSSISGRSPKMESSCSVDNSKSINAQQPNSEANWQTCNSTKYLPHLHSSISGRSPKMESSCSVDNSKSINVQQPNSEANWQTCDSTRYLPHSHSTITGSPPKMESSIYSSGNIRSTVMEQPSSEENCQTKAGSIMVEDPNSQVHWQAHDSNNRVSHLQSITGERPSKIQSSTYPISEAGSIIVEESDSEVKCQASNSPTTPSRLQSIVSGKQSKLEGSTYPFGESKSTIAKQADSETNRQASESKKCLSRLQSIITGRSSKTGSSAYSVSEPKLMDLEQPESKSKRKFSLSSKCLTRLRSITSAKSPKEESSTSVINEPESIIAEQSEPKIKQQTSLSAKSFPPFEIMSRSQSRSYAEMENVPPGSRRSLLSRHTSIYDPSILCNKEFTVPLEKGQMDIKRSRTGAPLVQPVVGFCTSGKCGGERIKSIKYALVKISEFIGFSTYEIMKPYKDKPKHAPTCIAEIFVTSPIQRKEEEFIVTRTVSVHGKQGPASSAFLTDYPHSFTSESPKIRQGVSTSKTGQSSLVHFKEPSLQGNPLRDKLTRGKNIQLSHTSQRKSTYTPVFTTDDSITETDQPSLSSKELSEEPSFTQHAKSSVYGPEISITELPETSQTCRGDAVSLHDANLQQEYIQYQEPHRSSEQLATNRTKQSDFIRKPSFRQESIQQTENTYSTQAAVSCNTENMGQMSFHYKQPPITHSARESIQEPSFRQESTLTREPSFQQKSNLYNEKCAYSRQADIIKQTSCNSVNIEQISSHCKQPSIASGTSAGIPSFRQQSVLAQEPSALQESFQQDQNLLCSRQAIINKGTSHNSVNIGQTNYHYNKPSTTCSENISKVILNEPMSSASCSQQKFPEFQNLVKTSSGQLATDKSCERSYQTSKDASKICSIQSFFITSSPRIRHQMKDSHYTNINQINFKDRCSQNNDIIPIHKQPSLQQQSFLYKTPSQHSNIYYQQPIVPKSSKLYCKQSVVVKSSLPQQLIHNKCISQERIPSRNSIHETCPSEISKRESKYNSSRHSRTQRYNVLQGKKSKRKSSIKGSSVSNTRSSYQPNNKSIKSPKASKHSTCGGLNQSSNRSFHSTNQNNSNYQQNLYHCIHLSK